MRDGAGTGMYTYGRYDAWISRRTTDSDGGCRMGMMLHEDLELFNGRDAILGNHSFGKIDIDFRRGVTGTSAHSCVPTGDSM